jgi:hypothetical protein
MKNQLLAQTEQKIESNLYGRTKGDYAKAVVAGMKAALHGGPNSILAKLNDSKNPIHDCVMGALNLAIILRKQSRNTMPLQAMIPAATTLMLHAMDFAEELHLVQIDKPELDQATHLLVNTLFKRLGITPNMLNTAAGKMHSLTQNPVSMERMKYAAGMTKSPNSPVPTPLPDQEGVSDGEAA